MDILDLLPGDTYAEALLGASDDDLLFAVILVNTTTAMGNLDRDSATALLASLFLVSKSEAGASALAPVMFEVVSPWPVLRAIAGQVAMADLPACVRIVSALPGGSALLNSAARALMVSSPRSYATTLHHLLEHVTDASFIAQAVRDAAQSTGSRDLAMHAAELLKQRGCADECNSFALKRPTWFDDTTWRAFAAGASSDVLNDIATDPEASFIEREYAQSLLPKWNLREIIALSQHENVRRSAQSVLLRSEAAVA